MSKLGRTGGRSPRAPRPEISPHRPAPPPPPPTPGIPPPIQAGSRSAQGGNEPRVAAEHGSGEGRPPARGAGAGGARAGGGGVAPRRAPGPRRCRSPPSPPPRSPPRPRLSPPRCPPRRAPRPRRARTSAPAWPPPPRPSLSFSPAPPPSQEAGYGLLLRAVVARRARGRGVRWRGRAPSRPLLERASPRPRSRVADQRTPCSRCSAELLEGPGVASFLTTHSLRE